MPRGAALAVPASAPLGGPRGSSFCSLGLPRGSSFCSLGHGCTEVPRLNNASSFCSLRVPRASSFCSLWVPRGSSFCSLRVPRASSFCSLWVPRGSRLNNGTWWSFGTAGSGCVIAGKCGCHGGGDLKGGSESNRDRALASWPRDQRLRFCLGHGRSPSMRGGPCPCKQVHPSRLVDPCEATRPIARPRKSMRAPA